jgi:hypothetical protein
MRLPYPQQIEVGAVQDHQSLHGVFLLQMNRRTSAAASRSADAIVIGLR